ncbi:MAG: glucose-1-phosphate cytidylyltransferase [bacterium]
MKLNEIPVVILAGGMGMRLREQTEFKPKPMVQIGNKPILWHIIKIYAYYGFKNFIICLGYKGEIIKDYFLRYRVINSDFSIETGEVEKISFFKKKSTENWKITLVNTGLETMTGARIKKIENLINSPHFFLTYGDGVANINIRKLMDFHIAHKKAATVTGVRPPARFGELIVDGKKVAKFSEKSQVSGGIINGGFFVFSRKVFKYLSKDENCALEKEPLEMLARDAELMFYWHNGFWQCMDTMRDFLLLNKLWDKGKAPWKIWE